MYKLGLIAILISLGLSAKISFNLDDPKTLESTIQNYFEPVLKEKNRDKIEASFKEFYKLVKEQENITTKATPQKNAQDINFDSPEVTRLQRILEISVTFESLFEFINTPEDQRNCSKFEHDFRMEVGVYSTQLTVPQKLVLDLAERICSL